MLTRLRCWGSVFKECNSIPFALAQHQIEHLENYVASLVLVCLKHLMLGSELHLLDDFNLAVRGLKCFGVSPHPDKQQLGLLIGVASLQS